MKILLVAPYYPNRGMDQAIHSPPLGLMSIAGAISSEHDVEIIDLKSDQVTTTQLTQKLAKVDLVGVSMMTTYTKSAIEVLKLAKAQNVITVAGGFHPSLYPEIVKHPYIDIVVRGEGEATMQELVNGAPLREIRGISYLKDGKVVHNPVQPLIADLDTLPFPRRDLVKLARYHYLYIPADVVETSRGCVYKCTFCCITKFYSHTYRTKSVTRVIEEIKRIDENKKLIFFVDDNFTLNMARVHNICEEICNAGISKWFACQSRVDTIARYPDVVAKMADAGFKLVFLGVESIHQKSLDLMQKKTRTEQLNRAIEILHDNGMMVYGSFIIGNLGETRADVEHMIEKIKAIDIDIMQAQPLTPFPGTQLYEDAKRNNWFKDGNELWWENWDFRAVMATPDLTCEDIDELVRLSLKKFYYNWRWYFGKSKWKRLLHPKFRWWWEIGSRFIWEGAKNFILKLGRE